MDVAVGDGGKEQLEEMAAFSGVKLPGFRFHPTDEELVSFYLCRRVRHRESRVLSDLRCLIPDLDIYKYDPWELPRLAKLGETHSGCYFFSRRDRKYRNSARPNRMTHAGFWKATGTDRPVHCGVSPRQCIGLKKSLVFYSGRASRGSKTDWMMHEFRLPNQPDSSNEDTSWALCKIFKRKSSNSECMYKRQAVATEELPFIAAETGLDKLKALEKEDSSEEDAKSNDSTHVSLSQCQLSCPVDTYTRSQYLSPSKSTADPPEPPHLRGSADLFPRRKESLTVRISKASNVWADDLSASCFMPDNMEPFSNRMDGQLCLDQPQQESSQVLATPDCFSDLYCSLLWSPTPPL